MAQRIPQERRLLDMAAQYMPGGTNGNLSFSEDLNFLVREGRGSHVWDVSGNEYVDWIMGSGPMILGHAHPAVTEAVVKAVEQGSTFFSTNEKAVLLADELVKAVPCAEQVGFTTSGTDACFQAMRAARAYRGRDKILKFEGGYHGTSDYAQMSVTPSAREEFPHSEANNGGIPKAIQELMLIAPFNDLETTTAIIEAHHDELGGVIVEPLQRALVPQPGFLQGLREVTAHYGIPLIFDEVVTGFRLAYGGAQEYYGVVPDLVAYAKALGGGYPIGAFGGRAEIMDMVGEDRLGQDDYVWMASTYGGNPVSAAAARATLGVFRQPGTYEHLYGLGKYLREGLRKTLAEHQQTAQVTGDGPLVGMVFSPDPVTDYRTAKRGDSAKSRAFLLGMFRRGIFLNPMSTKFYLSLAHSRETCDRFLDRVADTLPELPS